VRSMRRWATVAAVAVVLLAAVIAALAFTAAPASAFGTWAHDGATECVDCHGQGTPTNATCTNCHAGYVAFPGDTCWNCHAPGQNPVPTTAPTPSSACSQECHLWNSTQKQYNIPFSHGDNPHLGSTPECLDCHSTSPSWDDPGSSPHHSGQATGFNQCGACHSSQQKHAGKVACESCHTDAQAFHLYQASSPGFKKCGSCHSMRHAGKRIAQTKCAACHQGSSGRAAQHSSSITKKFVCGGCHKKALHASRVSKAVSSCRTCHAGRYHAAQKTPSRNVCTRCHSRALNHANGYQCTLCHLRAVHNSRPSAVN
jgi:hypothetical protein